MSGNRIGNFGPSSDNDDNDELGGGGSTNRRSRSTDDVRGRKDKKRSNYSQVNYSERLITAREKGLPKVGTYEPVDVSKFKQTPVSRKIWDPKTTPRIGSGLRRAQETQRDPKPRASQPSTPSYVCPDYEPYKLNYMNYSGFIHSDKKKKPRRGSPDPDFESPPPRSPPKKIPSKPKLENKEPNRRMDIDPEDGRKPHPSQQSPPTPQRSPSPRSDSPLDYPRNPPVYPHNAPRQPPTLPSSDYQPDPRQFPRSPARPDIPEFHGKQLPRSPVRTEAPELRPMFEYPENQEVNRPQFPPSPTPLDSPEIPRMFEYPGPPETQELHRLQGLAPPTPPELKNPYDHQPFPPELQPNYQALPLPQIQPSIAVPLYNPAIYVPDTRKEPESPSRQTTKPNQFAPLQPTTSPQKGPPSQPAPKPYQVTPPYQTTPPSPTLSQKQATPTQPSSQPNQAAPLQSAFQPNQATPRETPFSPQNTTPPQIFARPKRATDLFPVTRSPFQPKQTTPPPKSYRPKQTTPPQRVHRPKQATPPRAEPSKYPTLPKYSPPPPREIRHPPPSMSKYSPINPPLMAPPSRRLPPSTYDIPKVKVSRPYEPYYDLSSPSHSPYYPFDDKPSRNYRAPATRPPPDAYGYPEYPLKAAKLMDRLPEYRRDDPAPLPPLTTYYPPTLGVEKAGLYEMGTILRSMAMYRHPEDPGSWSVRK